jgi:hypothetical protein
MAINPKRLLTAVTAALCGCCVLPDNSWHKDYEESVARGFPTKPDKSVWDRIATGNETTAFSAVETDGVFRQRYANFGTLKYGWKIRHPNLSFETVVVDTISAVNRRNTTSGATSLSVRFRWSTLAPRTLPVQLQFLDSLDRHLITISLPAVTLTCARNGEYQETIELNPASTAFFDTANRAKLVVLPDVIGPPHPRPC